MPEQKPDLEFETKLKETFSHHIIVDRKDGTEISFIDFMRLLNEVFSAKEKKLERAYMKMIMDYLHVVGAVLQQNGGSVEVQNVIAANLPDTFYITAKKNKEKDSTIYKICANPKENAN
jgi:hypothetical protein